MLGWMHRTAGLLLLACACGPSLTDEPRAYEGTNAFAIAGLCGGETVGAGEQIWAKFAVRYIEDVSPAWEAETIEVRGAVLARRAAGRPTAQESGHIRRIETFWVTVPESAKPGDLVRVGPLALPYRQGGHTTRSASHAGCSFTVE